MHQTTVHQNTRCKKSIELKGEIDKSITVVVDLVPFSQRFIEPLDRKTEQYNQPKWLYIYI